jgi:predicted ATPase
VYVDKDGHNDNELEGLVEYLKQQLENIEDIADQWFKIIQVLSNAKLKYLLTSNEELKSALGRSVTFWQTGQERLIPLEQRWFYWWGSNGCGRTHLLKAMSHAA